MSDISADGPRVDAGPPERRDAPSFDVDLDRVWTYVAAEVWRRKPNRLERLTGRLLRSPGLARALLTTPSLLLPWLIASIAVLTAGVAATLGTGQPLVALLAPALAGAGIAYAYGPGIDPAWELSRSMAVGDRMVAARARPGGVRARRGTWAGGLGGLGQRRRPHPRLARADDCSLRPGPGRGDARPFGQRWRGGGAGRLGHHGVGGQEPVEPSLGFAERLVRQLNELSKTPSVSDFFERVGRRFVYATLVLTLLALLALTVPSAGPVRGLGAADIQISAQEASLAYSDPIGEAGGQETPDVAPVEAPAPAVTNEVK